MDRFIAFDLGEKRIGVAVSDPFNKYALPMSTYHRKNLKTDLAVLKKLIEEKRATAIVCGLPVNFDGTESIQTGRAKFFIEKLKEVTGLPVYTVDERCTSIEAHETLKEENYSYKESMRYVDTLAATLILEDYLNNNYKKEQKMEEKEKTTGCCDCGEDDCDCCDEEAIYLESDDGSKIKCYYLGDLEHKGKNYVAFQTAEPVEGEEEGCVYIYEDLGGDEEMNLAPITDDALLDEVYEAFCESFDEDDECDGCEEESCDCCDHNHDHE